MKGKTLDKTISELCVALVWEIRDGQRTLMTIHDREDLAIAWAIKAYKDWPKEVTWTVETWAVVNRVDGWLKGVPAADNSPTEAPLEE